MTGWIIFGVIVLILVGINLIPVGADIAYEGGEFRLSAKVAGKLIQLLPKQEQEKDETSPKKEKKPKRKKKAKEKPEEEEQPKKKGLPLGFTKEELFDLVKRILKTFARFPRKFCIDRFKLHILAAGADPYGTAMSYGYINEALSILLPLARRGFRVKHSDVWTAVNFTKDAMEIEAALGLSIRIGQIAGFVLTLAGHALSALIRSKHRQRKEVREEKKRQKQLPGTLPEHTEQTEKETILAEERMDANG